VHFKGTARPDALILAEGPETALSLWMATGIETWATIGPTHTVDLTPVPITRTIVVALDDDGRTAQVAKHTRKAITRWRKQNRTVLTALPWAATRRDKSDFNDALQEQGADAVRARIDAALTPVQNSIRTLSIDEARIKTTVAIDDATRKLLAGEGAPSAIAIKVSTGVGKTETYMRAIIALLKAGVIKAATFAVPDNKLSAEQIHRAEAIRDELGATFRIGAWRGREAVNPEAIKETMCRRPEAARAVGRAGLPVQSFLCKTDAGDKCPLYDQCAYQKQRNEPRLTITSHAAVFSEKPIGVPVPSLLVLDESFWDKGIVGADRPILTPLDELQGIIRLTHEHGRDLFGDIQAAREASATADLEPVREKLRAILATAPVGPLRREHVDAVGLTADQCRAAADAEHRRIVAPRIVPSMTESEIMTRLEGAAGNAGCFRRAALFSTIAAFIDGEVRASGHVLIDRTDDDRPAFRSLGRRPLGKGWHAPTLILDATLRPELVRPFFPDVEIGAEIEAETPFMRVVQHYSRSFAKSHFGQFVKGAGFTPDRKAVNRFWTWCRAEIQKADGKALVVAQKAVEDAIRAGHRVPDHIALAHHNAVAGKDGWRDVSTLISVGRTLPPPEAVEALAMALSGEWIDPATLPAEKNGSRWYAATGHPVADRSGNTITLTREHHPHPLAEAIRASICEDEIIQIIGRARGVNRTATDPVTVHICADLPLPVRVDEFRQWEAPSLDAAMMAEGCWTESCEDAARWWPEIIRTPMALKDDRRQRSVEFSYYSIPYENPTHLARLTYQKPGAGQRPVEAIFDLRLIADPAAWLTERLGPVAISYVGKAATPRKARRKAVTAPGMKVEIPGMMGKPPPPEALKTAKPLPSPWSRGTLPVELVTAAKARMRATNARHEDAARQIGISRQQWTNALNGRFGLSVAAATRLLTWLATLPAGEFQPDLQL
jgi:putative DNA primase/helicase